MGSVILNWLQWRTVFKPVGRFNRGQFVFWFSISVILGLLIANNMWGFEKLLIRLTCYVGLPSVNTRLWSQTVTVLLVLPEIYLAIIVIFKRCNNLRWSLWWSLLVLVPIVGVVFLTCLILWPGRALGEVRRIDWAGVILVIVVAPMIFNVVLLGSMFFDVSLTRWYLEKSLRLRLWNRTDEVIYVSSMVVEDSIYQGYPEVKVRPNEILRDEEILFRPGKYNIIAKNTEGEILHSRNFTSTQLESTNRFQRITFP